MKNVQDTLKAKHTLTLKWNKWLITVTADEGSCPTPLQISNPNNTFEQQLSTDICEDDRDLTHAFLHDDNQSLVLSYGGLDFLTLFSDGRFLAPHGVVETNSKTHHRVSSCGLKTDIQYECSPIQHALTIEADSWIVEMDSLNHELPKPLTITSVGTDPIASYSLEHGDNTIYLYPNDGSFQSFSGLIAPTDDDNKHIITMGFLTATVTYTAPAEA